MPPCYRVLTATFVLFVTFAVEGRGQQLLEVDGVELRGVAQLVLSGGGTCNVLESDTSYEERKENHGAPMDVWRLDFSVHNGSGRWLDHLIALFDIDSTWPECTNWDVPEAGRFAQPIEWARSTGFIQESGRNVVAPGQTLTHPKFFIVLRGDPEPQFENWSVDFDFAAAPPKTPESPVAEPRLSAEQDMVFWQSIMNSTNRADFEAYLKQFPEGVFRALAQNRLAALGAAGSDAPAANRFPAGTDSLAALDLRQADPSSHPGPQPACKGQAEGAKCWKELASHPACFVWDDHYYADQEVTWTGMCSDGLASGTGTLKWVRGSERHESTGLLRNGKNEGHWVLRDANGGVQEGPVVDGERNGRWSLRFPSGQIEEGAYVDGERHGTWVIRPRDEPVWEAEYVHGERVN